MTINYQFGDVDAHGATIGAQTMELEAEQANAPRQKVQSAESNTSTRSTVGSSWA